MRWLVLDHYFRQDIEALRQAAGDELQLEVIDYEILRREALRVLPAEVGNGLAAFTDPQLTGARRRWAAILREMLEDRFSSFAFDAFVVPSDTFFYVRAAPAIAHALGVPFLVAQKETTISEHTMREHTGQLRRFAPPQADRMTVCSERHKQFWVRAGAQPQRIVVTGQPRFDYYEQPSHWPDRPPGTGRDEPSVLFLSYAADAYHPGEGLSTPAWHRLREETEQALTALASEGWRVLVKPHPQQPLDSTRRWIDHAGALCEGRLSLLDAQADVRPLIVSADVVVGFQSTALLEAMLAGRPVIYTAWDPAAAGLGAELIPFERWGEEITVVRRAADMRTSILAARGALCPAATLQRRRAIAERYLGPLDGRAAERTLVALRSEVDAWAATRGAQERQLRARLSRRKPPLRLARRARALSRATKRHLATMLDR